MGKWRSRNKVNATGRNNTSRFARLDHRILRSGAYRALNPNARALLVELAMLHNGENNGSIYLSVRDAAHRMGVADVTAASRAFEDLVRLGFVEVTIDFEFRSGSSGQSRARCWRLTWLPGPGRKLPTWNFETQEPLPKTRERKRMERGLKALKAYYRKRDSGKFPVLDSDTLEVFRPNSTVVSVLDSDTLNTGNGGSPPMCIVPDSATHIAATRGRSAQNETNVRLQPDWGEFAAKAAFATIVNTIFRDQSQTTGATV